jgi:hypothetical protein
MPARLLSFNPTMAHGLKIIVGDNVFRVAGCLVRALKGVSATRKSYSARKEGVELCLPI